MELNARQKNQHQAPGQAGMNKRDLRFGCTDACGIRGPARPLPRQQAFMHFVYLSSSHPAHEGASQLRYQGIGNGMGGGHATNASFLLFCLLATSSHVAQSRSIMPPAQQGRCGHGRRMLFPPGAPHRRGRIAALAGNSTGPKGPACRPA